MARNDKWRFAGFEDLEQQWFEGQFDCDNIGEFTDPLVLDWCSRLDDWAPKVALCFNPHTSAVTLDRVSQCSTPEVRRMVCYHPNCSVETLERLMSDPDEQCRNTARECLEKRGAQPTRSFRRKMARANR